MSSQKTIDILLATYNGARYLQEQLDSILCQTDPGWRLSIRDDGSTDGTHEIIHRFAAVHADRVSVVSDGRANLGPMGNFGALLAESEAEYGMFCDQDDIWLPEKIATSRAAMAALEAKHGCDKPLFIHTDLRVVNEVLREIAPSFLRFRLIDPVKGRSLERLLVQNIAPGCASMFNAKLRELAAPIPEDAIIHDWWMILIAASLGAVDCIDEPLVLYRQHKGNALGAGQGALRETFAQVLANPAILWDWSETRVRQSQRQAFALEAKHGDRMQEHVHHLVWRYATLGQRSFIGRRIDLLRYDYRRNGSLVRNLALFLFV